MLFEVSQVVGLYLPVLVGIVAQIVFLMLPVNLRNWTDDFLNVFTYSGIQVLAAAMIFIALPRVTHIFHLSDSGSLFLMLAVFLASWIRALALIPLESTSPSLRKGEAPRKIQFGEFFDADRMRILAEISQNDPNGLNAFRGVREQLRRRKAEKSDGPAALPEA